MKHFGAFKAKTHFSELLNDVINGEKFIITKHGVEVAMIIPFQEGEETDPIADAIHTLKKLRKGLRLGDRLSVKKLREEGRK